MGDMSSFAPFHSAVKVQHPDGFSGPGLYHILSSSDSEKALQVYGPNDCRITALDMNEVKQNWTIDQCEPQRYKLFVESFSINGKLLALEAFPDDGVAKPCPPAHPISDGSDPDHQVHHNHQLWRIEQIPLNDGQVMVRFACETNTRGLLCLQISDGSNGGKPDQRLSLHPPDIEIPRSQLFSLDRLDQRATKVNFLGPGLYRIQCMAPHSFGMVLEAFPRTKEIRPRDLVPDNSDQHWNFVDHGDYFRINCFTAKKQHIAMEAFPRDRRVKSVPENSSQQDQYWQVVELGDGERVKLICKSKSRDWVCIGLPIGASCCVVEPSTSSPTQHFKLIPLFPRPKAFHGSGAYRIKHSRTGLFLEAFQQQTRAASGEGNPVIVKLQPTSPTMHQDWLIDQVATSVADGDMYKINCKTKFSGMVTWENCPWEDLIRLKPCQGTDQLWCFEEIGDGLHVRIFCVTEQYGKLYLEVPMGFKHATLRTPSNNLGQLFFMELLGEIHAELI